jgi:outer membrane biosynthesis protein TonB
VETPKGPVKEVKPETKPKVDQAIQEALSSVLNAPPADGTSSGSEGDDDEVGDKGNENGDPNAPDYYTNPGNGSGGAYDLIGRLPLRRPTPEYPCRKEGRVVVKIKVDRTGKVIEAIPGAKGSTTSESCLLNEAKKAALKTKWQPAANAPEKQLGKIIYNFNLR